MGIQGLQRFIETACPGCFYPVNIKDLVKTSQKNLDVGEKLVIAIDGQSCLNNLYKGLEWISGGQYNEYYERVKSFCGAFQKLGIHLIFFFCEYSVGEKIHKSHRKHIEKTKLAHEIFDIISRRANFTSELTSDSKNYYGFVPNLHFVQHYVTTLPGVETHQTLGDRTQELATFAKKNNCLAILGQDSDYIILEGGKHYLSMLHLDLENMTTYAYDRNLFAKFLNLTTDQLPIFGTLVGNEVINRSNLLPFHHVCVRKHTERSYRDKSWIRTEEMFKAVANYVSNQPSAVEVCKNPSSLSKDVFNNLDSSSLLTESILFYLPLNNKVTSRAVYEDHPKWNEIILKAEEFYKANIFSSLIFSILVGDPVSRRTGLEDLEQDDLPNSVKLSYFLRQKLYGILLKERPNIEPIFPREWILEPYHGEFQLKRLVPIMPEDPHPGLLTLWNEDCSEERLAEKWLLFCHAISPRFNPNELRGLSHRFIIPTATLVYFQTSPDLELDSWEVEALIAMLVLMPKISSKSSSCSSSNTINARAVQISSIFISTSWIVAVIFGACGYPVSHDKIFSHSVFDGRLFQEKYEAQGKKSQISLCNNEKSVLASFQQIHKIVFKDRSRK